MDDDRIRPSDVSSGVDHHAENLPQFPDFAWKMTRVSSLEMIFKNQADMFDALEKCKSMRLPTVKAVEGDPD